LGALLFTNLGAPKVRRTKQKCAERSLDQDTYDWNIGEANQTIDNITFTLFPERAPALHLAFQDFIRISLIAAMPAEGFAGPSATTWELLLGVW
jgi:hypothetical protein